MGVREIDIAESWDSALPLMQANWRETGGDFAFVPSREFYVSMQQAGFVFALGAFHDDQLHGYAIVTVAPHPFNPGVRVASVNPLYVDPQFRGGLLPGRLILLAEEKARERGAAKLYMHARAGTALDKVLTKHGYTDCDNVVGKNLEH
jgi:GNAT superfamily N-acetyltransferase